MSTTRFVLSLVLSSALMAASCGDGGKAPAEAALGSAQTAFDAAKSGASTYVPDQLKAVEGDLAAARATFDKGDYVKALSEAQALTPKIAALVEATSAKRTEFTNNWTALSASLPTAVSEIQARLASLSKTRRLPAGITAPAVTDATSGLETITSTWTEATAAFRGGNIVDAVTKAQSAKAKAAEVMTALGMQVPDALK